MGRAVERWRMMMGLTIQELGRAIFAETESAYLNGMILALALEADGQKAEGGEQSMRFTSG